MPLDPSIILRGQAPQIDSPAEVMSKMMSLKQLANQGKITEQALAEKRAIKDAYAKGVVTNPDGSTTLDRKATLSALYKTAPEKATEVESAMSKISWEENDSKLKALTNQVGVAKSLAWSIRDEQTYQTARQKGIELGLPNAHSLPPNYDPAYVKRMQMGTLNAEEQMAQRWKEREFGQKERELQQKLGESKNFVPGLGYALNADDAKKLKDAKIMKEKFDRQIGELISLREEKGVEHLDREAVGRGRQLSKDLLLTYKNLSKLGVLSKADEAIVAAIIPENPLGNDWMPGQDSILHQLKKFKVDLEDDYQSTLATRLKSSMGSVAGRREDSRPPGGGSGFGIDKAHAGDAPSVFKTDQIDWAD